MSLFGVVLLLNICIILPVLTPDNRTFSVISGIVTFFVFLAFFFASCKDAGTLRPIDNFTFLELLRDINPADLCPECQVIRTARSRHCAICNQCVERFDHHCPWINNCVGINNHNAFIMFLVAIWVKIIYHLAVDLYGLYLAIDDLKCDTTECREMCFYCDVKPVYLTSCSICLLICLFYLLLSSSLIYIHALNYFANRTTNERLSKKR